jgi:hypothetical protein
MHEQDKQKMLRSLLDLPHKAFSNALEEAECSFCFSALYGFGLANLYQTQQQKDRVKMAYDDPFHCAYNTTGEGFAPCRNSVTGIQGQSLTTARRNLLSHSMARAVAPLTHSTLSLILRIKSCCR